MMQESRLTVVLSLYEPSYLGSPADAQQCHIGTAGPFWGPVRSAWGADRGQRYGI